MNSQSRERQSRKSLATKLRHRVTIQRSTPTYDGEGGYVDAWADVATVWAAVDPIRAQQLGDYASTGVEATHIIQMRAEADVLERDQLVFGSRVFEVLTIENIQERGVYLVMTCKERR